GGRGARAGGCGEGGAGAGGRSPADAAKIVAIEEVGTGILSERQDERSGTGRRGHIQWQRVGAAEVGIACVECVPVGRGEEILRSITVTKLRRQAKDRLTIAPSRGSQ